MPAFTPDQMGRVAEKLRDNLDDTIRTIAENKGRVSGFKWSPREVSGLSDGELCAFCDGIRSVALSFADWFEGYDFGEHTDTLPLRRHSATVQAIDNDIAGAEGENLYRRNPGRRAFAGRLRKYNDTIAAIRKFRVDLRAMYWAEINPGKPYTHQGSNDAAFEWQMNGSQQINRFLSSQKWRHDTDEEQRAALERTHAEFMALDRYCDQIRHSYGEECRLETQRVFERSAA